MFQDKTRDKHGFLVETVKASIKAQKPQGSQERPLWEQREWDPTISDKLLFTPPKVDRDGFPVPDSEVLEKCPNNAYRILVFDNRIKNRLGYDEARRSWVIRDEIPYSERRLVKWTEIPALYEGKPWRILTGHDQTWIRGFLATHYRLNINSNDLMHELDLACQVNRFHSIRDWLETLSPKPGMGLSEDWLIRLCGAEDTPLNRAYCVRILQAAVARAYEPGCKLDTMPVVYGGQGGGKSEMWIALAGEIAGVRQHVVFDEKIGSPDAVRVMHSAWCVDLDECGALKRCRDPEIPKQWITRREDAIVQKFKNDVEKWPRSSFLVSSSNPSAFIKDPAGARRWWVIEVGTVNLDGIAQEREQLFAEAVARYKAWKVANDHFEALKAARAPAEDIEIAKEKAKELHWSLPPYLWKAQAESVEFCTTDLPFEEKIEAFLHSRGCKKISTNDIIRDCIRYASEEQPGDSNDVASAMYRLGWKKVRYVENGLKIRGWEKS